MNAAAPLILRAADRVAAPWKNGGGVTREVAVHPPGAGLDDFDWRVSMASVDPGGPFSSFPGVDRILAVLEGRLALRVDGSAPIALRPDSPPYAFAGDIPAQADLPYGPVADLNVMTRRGRIGATVERLIVNAPTEVAVASTAIILTLTGGVTLTHRRRRHVLCAGDAALFHQASEPARLDPRQPSTLFLIGLISL